MSIHRITVPSCHLLEGSLQRGILEGLDLATGVADEMVVMVPAVRVRDLEAGNAVADVHTLHEPELGERIEHPIDTRDPDASTRCPDSVEDLLGGATAVLAAEVLDDRSPRAAVAQSGTAESEECLIRPGF